MRDVITVTALNKYVKTILEKDSVLDGIAIRGEISNFVNHFKTGHFYFTVKDGQCSVKAVMFKSDATRLAFMPQNGMNVILRCRVSLFERDGAFQLYVEDMFPDGVGAMQLAFEQMKERLEKEGLFKAEYKKSIPAMPKTIGLITSKTGAAIQDIYNVTQRRNPLAKFVLFSVTVQGSGAGAELAKAVDALDKSNLADVIIVARGGGSKEDLWAFNDEGLARAVFAAKTPIVSAVGHEIDFTILDFVSDLRAPTPSAAAELVMPDLYAILQNNTILYTNIRKAMQKHVNLCYNILKRSEASSALNKAHAMPRIYADNINATSKHIYRAMHQSLQKKQLQLRSHAALAETLSPYAVLKRGYAIAKDKADLPIRDAAKAKKGDIIKVILQNGSLGCEVKSILEDASL
ncbi:MAG: exodeoxyribonuclease VII large subunit [Oscillospiraceae bacterium]